MCFWARHGSVLIAILLHASTNLFGVSPPIGPDGDLTVPLVALVLKWVLAVALFVRLPRSFSDGSAEFHCQLLLGKSRELGGDGDSGESGLLGESGESGLR
jgi:hypothetical protein